MLRLRHQAFAAITNSDLTEGRGREVIIGYFLLESDAKKAARGQGVMGTDGDVRPRMVDVKIYETYFEYELDVMEHKRREALSKLTADERRLLGLE